MKCPLINLESGNISDISIPQNIAEAKIRSDIMHKIVHWQLAKRRSGTHSVKEIATISGSTRKIYAQKGTGQARHGSRKMNIFRGGAVIFGPVTRSHGYSLNKKLKVKGLQSAIAQKISTNSLIIAENFKIKSHKTSNFINIMKKHELNSVLFVDIDIDDSNNNMVLACRNLRSFVMMLPFAAINVYDIIRHDKLVLTKEALEYIEVRIKYTYDREGYFGMPRWKRE